MEISDEMWKEVGYVTSSTYRTRVMKTLEGEVKIPKKLQKIQILFKIIYLQHLNN